MKFKNLPSSALRLSRLPDHPPSSCSWEKREEKRKNRQIEYLCALFFRGSVCSGAFSLFSQCAVWRGGKKAIKISFLPNPAFLPLPPSPPCEITELQAMFVAACVPRRKKRSDSTRSVQETNVAIKRPSISAASRLLPLTRGGGG